MSEDSQSQAIMFEPTDEEELRAGRGDLGSRSVGDAITGRVSAGEIEGACAPEQITFEQGYEELKGIVSRLDDPELPIHEMFEGFRRGKGLEKALRAYLQEREGELAELEEGNNLPEFEIASPSGGPVVG
jgi:exodeoxyribonuclease VII small subunit